MPAEISLRTARRCVFASIAVMVGIGLPSTLLGPRPGEALDGLSRLVAQFSLDSERSVAPWLASSLMTGAAAILLLLALLAAPAGRPRERPAWLVYAAVLLAMSADETIQIHEHVNGLALRHVAVLGQNAHKWVVFGLALVLVLAVPLLRLARRLDRWVAGRLVGAATVFVAGALGVEALGGYARSPEPGTAYLLLSCLEESLEFLGLALLVATLLEVLDLRLRAVASRGGAGGPAPA